MLKAVEAGQIIHRPWMGADYGDGIEGRRVMIIGNSHWLSANEPDSVSVTEGVLSKVIAGEYNIAFFNHIRNYFGFSAHRNFWRRVAFMNYAPWAIGEGHQRYAHLTGSMVAAAKNRFSAEITQHAPDIVFVFSKKIQWALPELDIQHGSLPLPGARIGTLPSAPAARVLLLRHTQGAPKLKMIETVTAALRL